MERAMCVVNVLTHPVYQDCGWDFVPKVGSIYTIVCFVKAGQPAGEGIAIWDSYHIEEMDGSFPVDCFATLGEEKDEEQVEIVNDREPLIHSI